MTCTKKSILFKLYEKLHHKESSASLLTFDAAMTQQNKQNLANEFILFFCARKQRVEKDFFILLYH